MDIKVTPLFLSGLAEVQQGIAAALSIRDEQEYPEDVTEPQTGTQGVVDRRCRYRSCSTMFTPSHDKEQYCCVEHFKLDEASKPVRPRRCKWCGDHFYPEHLKQRCCSREHFDLYTEKNLTELPVRLCRECGGEFKPRHDQQFYCSAQHHADDVSRRVAV